MSFGGPLLAVDGLRVEFWTSRGTIHAVNGISFSIGVGETLGIVGESGCGKSVTSLALLGILPRAGRAVAGTALFEGRDLLRLPDRELRDVRGKDVAMIFQDPMTSLNPVLTIGRQIREALQTHFDLDRDAAKIAMALACRPKLLIADEPTTALDVTIQAQILDLLRGLVADTGMALILITHDLGVVAGMCERVNVMYGGMFMESGSAEQLFARPRHPYTLGLLQSVPRLDASQRDRLTPIEGAPRDMLTRPRSCPFQPRCRYAVDRSARELPQLREVEPGHFVACFNPVPAEEWAASRKVAAR